MFFRRREPADVPGLRARLREAAAWCADIVGSDPNARLWTPGLLDVDVAAAEDAIWKALTTEPESTIATVVQRRQQHLARRPDAGPARLDGRVLVCEYDCTMFDGASRFVAPGFVDLWDVPAWDTWIGLVPPSSIPVGGRDRVHPLLAWIPSPLVPGAHSAIEVNPVEVLSWLDTRNPRLARALLARD
jgi:hypothetical protein